MTGPEYQVLDNAKHADGKKPKTSAASAYDVYEPSKDVTRPVGEWNQTRILVNGNHVEHWLNGVKVVEYDRNTPEFRTLVAASKFHIYPHFGEANEGYLLLQDHGFPVSFRNIKIREFPSAPPE